ncbi:uridine diphosphate glucose pyrophosphatase NUDT14 isoform X2 [Spodoptera frugiperda]|uniref:Uridine diphosphate glucose pyrophosphatase NUDT14 n=1 Tax=Spodoptera frugiperda TaxID=7108 RepID=A0A9R0EPY8_SPOFR|nr:uridine diphosphate glucose pyrophosphatase NUDT14 isoform X2 [Spodoptera frugiperda]
MENMVITDVFMTVLPDNATVRPLRFFYSLDNKMMSRDMIEVTDSVFVIVFNVTRRMMVMAKHFRPAVYFNCIPPAEREAGEIDTNKYPASLGITLEMCAGIVDKNKSLQEIAKEEVLEECGYDVPLRELHQIASYRAGVGVQGSLQTLFYCEVTDDMKVGKGGGVEDEIIEVVEKSIADVEKWISGPGPLNTPPSCLFALMWFLRHKADKYRKSFERYCGECKVVQDDGFFATSSD